MMSDTTTATATGEPGVEAAPMGELTELARLEIRVGKILEVKSSHRVGFNLTFVEQTNDASMMWETFELSESYPEPN